MPKVNTVHHLEEPLSLDRVAERAIQRNQTYLCLLQAHIGRRGLLPWEICQSLPDERVEETINVYRGMGLSFLKGRIPPSSRSWSNANFDSTANGGGLPNGNHF